MYLISANYGKKQHPMKTLIVATDSSEAAESAVEFAGAMAKDLRARVILFNAFRLPLHSSNSLISGKTIDYLTTKNDKILHDRTLKLARDYAIEVSFRSGFLTDVNDELWDLFEEYHADMIVMGMASASVEQTIFGNTTTAAIMRRKFPVLAVPAGTMYHGIRRMLFAVDAYDEVKSDTLVRIKDIAEVLQAEIEFFNVQQAGDHSVEVVIPAQVATLESNLAGVVHHYKSVESKSVIDEIKDEVKKSEADLLIMVPHTYGLWGAIFHRSKTRQMASDSVIPLLSIPS